MKNLFLDTEFTSLKQNTTLISIGIVSDCGKFFYAEFNDYNEEDLDQWILENVIKNLEMKEPTEGEDEEFTAIRSNDNPVGDLYKGFSLKMRGSKREISTWLETWIKQFPEVQIWSDCLSYDWVLFCDLFGGALRIPENIYYIPFDLSTALLIKGWNPDIDREDLSKMGRNIYQLEKTDLTGIIANRNKHNALHDAFIIQKCVDIVTNHSF